MAARHLISVNPALKLIPMPTITVEPQSVYPQTVIMQDDSMAPIFSKGDLLTIDPDLIENIGDFVLVRASDGLYAIRRFTTKGNRMNFVPENPAYPEMLETDCWPPESLGPVVAVQRV